MSTDTNIDSGAYLSNDERRALNGQELADIGFKIKEVLHGQNVLLIGEITTGEHAGKKLRLRADDAAKERITARAEVASHISSTEIVPVHGSDHMGKFLPAVASNNIVIALAMEDVAPADNSKTFTEALQGLPEIKISSMRLSMGAMIGERLPRSELGAVLTGDIRFADESVKQTQMPKADKLKM